MNGRVTVTSPGAALRLVRVLRITVVVAQILFLYYLVIRFPIASPRPLDPTAGMVITGLALANVVLGFVFPRYFLRIRQRAQGNAAQAALLQRWVTANVVGFAFLESCSLFGVALHFLGAALRRSELLIGVGIVATVFFSLGAPPGPEEGSAARN